MSRLVADVHVKRLCLWKSMKDCCLLESEAIQRPLRPKDAMSRSLALDSPRPKQLHNGIINF